LGSMMKTVRTCSEFQHHRDVKMGRIHSKGKTLFVDVARILVIKHVIERRNPPVAIGDLWSA
jgi:hypothetical protein